jgi:hypothetical protein
MSAACSNNSSICFTPPILAITKNSDYQKQLLARARLHGHGLHLHGHGKTPYLLISMLGVQSIHSVILLVYFSQHNLLRSHLPSPRRLRRRIRSKGLCIRWTLARGVFGLLFVRSPEQIEQSENDQIPPHHHHHHTSFGPPCPLACA